MGDSILHLEKLRKRALSLFTKTIIISSSATLLSSMILVPRGYAVFAIGFSILLGIGTGFLMAVLLGFFRANQNFLQAFKASLVEAPICDTFSQVVYNPTKGIEKEVIKQTGIMSMGNIFLSNDYIQGYYRDVRFERSDVTIQDHVNLGKTSYTTTYLKGRWLIFEFNKDFQFDLQVIDKKFKSTSKNSSIFTQIDKRRHRIKFEDSEFNETFRVYGQDDPEAYYILTPQFMAVIKEMKCILDGTFMLGFINNQLHVAIHTNKDPMEPSIFKNIDLHQIQSEVQTEIDIIINIIDSLDLDRVFYKHLS